jgi:uncharacterized LabA/DUF88 family protein
VSTERVRIFCDFWNFQLNWNERTNRAQCDWRQLAQVLVEQAASLLPDVTPADLEFVEMRVYASVNPASEKDRGLAKWLDTFLNRQPGIRVFRADRSTKVKPVKCSHCQHEVANCPNCGRPYSRSIEKGVDAAMVTDLLSLAWEGAYDVAILITSDADFVPAVERLQEKGLKVVNATWKDHGFDLAKSSWASFELDKVMPKLKRNG